MRKQSLLSLLSLALVLLLPWPAHAEPRVRTLTVAQVSGTTTGNGVFGGDLADTLVTASIDTQTAAGRAWTEVAFHADVTVGTTTAVTVTCEESNDATVWVFIHYCPDNAASTCVKQVLTFDVSTLADFSFTVKTRAPWVRCTFDDLADGTGTVSVTASLVSF